MPPKEKGATTAAHPCDLATRFNGPLLDGPVFLRQDCAPAVRYDEGMINIPAALWGHLC